MTLIPVETPEDFLLAQQFIIPHEETCASLASLVRRKSDKLVFITTSDEPVVSTLRLGSGTVRPSAYSTTDVLGILNLDSTIYHCIPDPSLLDADFLKEQLPYHMKKPVRCISGEEKATNFLIEIFNLVNGGFDTAAPTQPPKIIYSYKMMRWLSASEAGVSKPPAETVLSGGEEIIRCTEHDMEILHPLQKDYMKEEVAVPGRPITDAEVDISLRQILKNQLCFALTVDGDIVAKANTNAIGINCVQIGGVYTHPLYRRNGYAGALVQALCNRALRSGKKPVLFVKEKNMPAFTLYRKLGFEECGRYTIAYY
ncbi:GNAT family N-acetyltransferase [Treponema bryantii]|uniref:GNAT family N-acetyltransferase n=1 Tax=Treponema bryantii TaxID=163 RepID=UPI0003B75F42|nr:GNAT family N-acetyltransferase [Treponema bryantii]